MSLLAMNSLYKKGHGRVPMVWRINVNAMCYEDNNCPRNTLWEIIIISQRENLNYFIVIFNWCALFFQYVCFLLRYVCRASYVKMYLMR